ncbi:MAG: 23S rRNA (pseudouridine(1915)-N(3))-methyltransferase RlmH [Casimicrobiaceae bacterium]
MRLSVLAVTAAQPGWVGEAVADYAKRFPAEWPFTSVDLRPEKRSGNRTTAHVLAAEAERIRASLPRQSLLVVCDERGWQPTSRELAAKLAAWSLEHPAAAFVIGSADGTDPALRAQAHTVLALSRLTLPHGLAKVLLVEQLYRAVSILKAGPYHRD